MDKFNYSYTLKVGQEHIDELNHVNNVVYVQWIQDAAVNHWNSAIPEEIRARYIWVIMRHEIDYKKPGLLDDELLITTKVLNAQRITSDRKVQIFRKADMALLVESKTTWCMLDAVTLKPARITDEIKTIFLPGQ
jgi:acyl-CoA thioester hydrolase